MKHKTIETLSKLRRLAYSLLSISLLYALSFVLVPNLSAEGTHATAGVAATPTLSVSPSSTVAFSVDPGTFNSASQTLSVSTTNYTGYTLSIKTSGSSSSLVNTTNSDYTLPSISGTKTSSEFGNNWGYSLDGTNYNAAPSSTGTGDEIESTNSANSTADTYTLTFGAKADHTVPAGTYNNTFTLTASANAALINITYNKNTTDTVTNLPTTADNTISGLTVYLSSQTPTRANYTFQNWNTEADGSGTSYNPGDTITIDPEINNSKTLYAQWKASKVTIIYDANGGQGDMPQATYKYTGKGDGDSFDLPYASNYSKSGYAFAGFSPDADAGTKLMDADSENDPVVFGPNEYVTLPTGFTENAEDGIVKLYAVWLPSQGNLQGWTGCSAMSTGEVTALTDTRDNNVYAVAKLADGKCWTTENLRLDLSEATITNANTNHPTSSFKTEANALSSESWDTCTSNSSSCDDHISYSLGNVNGSSSASYSGGSQTTPWASYGGMYNWYTATAGNGTYSKSSGNTDGDLCPSGWSLPTGNTSGEFNALNTALGGNTSTAGSRALRSFPNNFVYSGFYIGSSAYNRGSGGYYWSSTAYGTGYGYSLGFVSSYVYPGTYFGNKYYGFAVRCLAGSVENYTLTYDVNGGDAGTAPSSQTASGNGAVEFTLSDTVPTRSGYTFAGWMDENGTEAGAGETFTASDANTTLYAIWTNNSCNPSATTIGAAVCLQDMNGSVKSSMESKTTYTLKDARDNQSYTVALLDDGEVWMTQNLNYGSSSNTLLSAYDTDLPSGSAFVAPASTTSFETSNNSTTYVSPKILTNNTYGGYYSYAAAIASTDKYTTSNQSITTSICPSGWDLPTSNQYNNLRTVSGNTTYAKMSASPYSFKYAGYRNGTSFSSQTSAIRLWTSTNYSESYAYYTTAYGTASYSSNYKRYGESVRCVMSNGTGTIHYEGNGGTGSMNDQTNVEINTTTVSSNGFTAPDHKQFKNWNTESDGSGITVAPGASASSTGLSDGGTVTLYAQWDDVYVITFVNTATSATQTKSVVVGQSGTVAPSSSWSRSGYKLAGWDTVTNDASNTAGTVVYTNGQSITPTEDMTVYTIWRPVYTITYNSNGGDGGTMTQTHTNVGEGDTVNLYASNFNRSGYGFAGWSTDPNAADDIENATIYGPNESISAPAYDGNNTVTLYAVWVPSAGNLQGFTCSTLSSGEITALTDTRDNSTYAVAKLADGNCWMIENLRLDPAGKTLDSTNTNNPTSTFTDTVAALTSSTFATCQANSSACDDQFSLGLGNITGSTANPTTSNQSYRWYSYGGMYNWYTATAGNGTYSTGSNVTTSGDICPNGWHLPYGNSTSTTGNRNGGFYYLGSKLGATTSNTASSIIWRSFPNNFVYSGYYSGSSAGDRGSGGYYWSSTAGNTVYGYYLNFYSSRVNPGTGSYNRYGGFAVRCLAEASSSQSESTSGTESVSPSLAPETVEPEVQEQVAQVAEPVQSASVQAARRAPDIAAATEPEQSTEEVEAETEKDTEEILTGKVTPLGVSQSQDSEPTSDNKAKESNEFDPNMLIVAAGVGMIATSVILLAKKRDDEEE